MGRCPVCPIHPVTDRCGVGNLGTLYSHCIEDGFTMGL